MASQQKETVQIPSEYTKDEREAIAQDVVDFIRERTLKGTGVKKRGSSWNSFDFPGTYSKSYKKSLDYKNAGKSGKINLKLTGDMLDALGVLKTSKGKIEIGYDPGDPINGKVEGNRLGTYGKDTPIRGKARDFLGITKTDLEKILARYPLENDAKRTKRTAEILATIDEAAKTTSERFSNDEE